MAIHPEKRSTAMKIVIEGEELQLELLRLLKVAPYFGSMPDDKIELKCLVRLTKLCVLYNTLYPRMEEAPRVYLISRTLSQEKGLSADKLEEVLRMGMADALESLRNQPSLDPVDAALVNQSMRSNIDRMKELKPAATCNCLWAALVQRGQCNFWQAMQELLPAMRAAEEQEDALNGCPLQWLYCNLMLLAGSRPGHIITVSAFLAHVQKGRNYKNGWKAGENSLACTHVAGPLCQFVSWLSHTPIGRAWGWLRSARQPSSTIQPLQTQNSQPSRNAILMKHAFMSGVITARSSMQSSWRVQATS
ncbi:hypothetical protein WJX75_004460 [Coccomyxa subellipsoidea]|uniref:Uncharacterized protein n=1 Tax=Coccomyxa subellipsoidea TaxID=248742 RepID=A0ABR2YRP4_9CHLO